MDLDDFIKKNTVEFDSSHDYNHAKRVQAYAYRIARSMGITSETQLLIIQYAAGVHDLLDHKYIPTITKDMLISYLESKIGAELARIVIDITENISYSKEVRGELTNIGEYQLLRDIVSDADKIDALGEMGIIRCIEFTKSRLAKTTSMNFICDEIILAEVVNHCNEKLIHLKDNYIRTFPGKLIAESGHNFIIDWLKCPTILSE